MYRVADNRIKNAYVRLVLKWKRFPAGPKLALFSFLAVMLLVGIELSFTLMLGWYWWILPLVVILVGLYVTIGMPIVIRFEAHKDRKAQAWAQSEQEYQKKQAEEEVLKTFMGFFHVAPETIRHSNPSRTDSPQVMAVLRILAMKVAGSMKKIIVLESEHLKNGMTPKSGVDYTQAVTAWQKATAQFNSARESALHFGFEAPEMRTFLPQPVEEEQTSTDLEASSTEERTLFDVIEPSPAASAAEDPNWTKVTVRLSRVG